MARYRQKQKENHAVIVEAMQFDPKVQPWPEQIRPWNHWHLPRPIDESYGYILTDGDHEPVYAQNWIVTNELGHTNIYTDDAFQPCFELCDEDMTPLASGGVIQQPGLIGSESGPEHVVYPKIASTVDTPFLQQCLDELKALPSEERIRQIVQEEIGTFWKRQMTQMRMGPRNMEVK
jgi:hypothetical protein